jgi:hypothetical protein
MSLSWTALIPWIIGAILFVRLWRAAARLGDSALTAGAEKEPAGVEVLEPPRDLPASVVPYVLTPDHPEDDGLPDAVAAALVDLVRLGHLAAKESDGSVVFSVRSDPREDVPRVDGGLVERIRSVQASGRVDAAALRKKLESPGAMTAWGLAQRSWFTERHGQLLDPKPADAIVLEKASAFLAGGFFVMIPFFVLFDDGDIATVTAVSLWLSGAWLLVSAWLFGRIGERWYADKLDDARRWIAFGEALAAGRTLAAGHETWDRDLAYAEALGVAPHYVAKLVELAPTARGGLRAGTGEGVDVRALMQAVDAVARDLRPRDAPARRGAAPSTPEPEPEPGPLEKLRERYERDRYDR